uniref:Uncharacterized protein n=1 Tax=Panagrolaimus sp. JU765 TaxID=591449 RepID=A0AC34QM97_9BILA
MEAIEFFDDWPNIQNINLFGHVHDKSEYVQRFLEEPRKMGINYWERSWEEKKVRHHRNLEAKNGTVFVDKKG